MPAPRTTLRVALIAATVAALPWTAAGADPAEQITDVAGDAHGVTQPYYDGGAYGLLWDTVAGGCTLAVGEPDCTGAGTPIEALNQAEADLLGVKIETLYEAIPIGDDGIDYRATGIGFTLRTAAVPRRSAEEVVFRIYAELPNRDCRLNLRVTVPSTGAPSGDFNMHAGPTLATPCGEVEAHTPLDGSNLQVTTSPPGLRITVPYALFGPAIHDYIGVATSIMKPWFHSEIISEVTENPVAWTGSTLDKTPQYVGFYVGDDIPADVPCTKNCP